jgi:hypothetical protein
MTIGASLFLIAVGAILKFAITADPSGFDIDVAGVILMIVGGLALMLSLLFWWWPGRSPAVPPVPPPPP